MNHLVDDDVIAKEEKNIIDFIMELKVEALRKGIKANSIVINTNMVEVPATWISNCTGVMRIPHMICGLGMHFTKDELPEGYSCAVLEGPEHNDRLEQFESIGMEPNELRKAAELYRSIKEKMEESK